MILDNSGQTSTELILLIGGILIIVLTVIKLYQNYLKDFADEINKTEVKNLVNKIDTINNYL